MKTSNRSWIIPACFFLAAVIANLIGRALGDHQMAAIVKPALLPLLALTSVAYAGGMENRAVRLLVIAQLLGCSGDILLIPDGMIPFACGLLCFLAGHIFYFRIFGAWSWKGIKPVAWIGILAVMAMAVAGLLIGIGVEGVFLVPFAIYGLALMFLIFCGLAGIIRKLPNPGTWWIAFCGGLLFAFSDSLIAVQTFNGASIFLEFLVMLTYLAAQSLLAIGALRLAKSE